MKKETSRRSTKLMIELVVAWAIGAAMLVGGKTWSWRPIEELSVFDQDPRFSSLFLPAAIIGALVVLVVWLPLFGLRRLVPSVRPMWLFPASSVILGILFFALPEAFGDDGRSGLISPYVIPFYGTSIVVGTIVGFAFAAAYRKDKHI